MKPDNWKVLGFALASIAYWMIALGAWFLLLIAYGECFPPPQAGPSFVNDCQNEKILVVMSALVAIVLLYGIATWLVWRVRRSGR